MYLEPLKIEGLVTAIVTPMMPHGGSCRIDIDSLSCYLKHYVVPYSSAILVGGYTGNFLMLDREERQFLFSYAKQFSSKPVIAHVGAISTDEAASLALHAKECNIDAICSMLPCFYESMSYSGIHHYFEVLRQSALGIPLYLYDHPISKREIDKELLTRLLDDFPNIVGIKSSTDGTFCMEEFMAAGKSKRGENFDTWSGNDRNIVFALNNNLTIVSGNAAVNPGLLHSLIGEYNNGKILEGFRESRELLERMCERFKGDPGCLVAALKYLQIIEHASVPSPQTVVSQEHIEYLFEKING